MIADFWGVQAASLSFSAACRNPPTFLGVSYGLGRGAGVGIGLGVGVALGVSVAVGLGVTVAVGVAVAVAVGVGVGVGVGLARSWISSMRPPSPNWLAWTAFAPPTTY